MMPSDTIVAHNKLNDLDRMITRNAEVIPNMDSDIFFIYLAIMSTTW